MILLSAVSQAWTRRTVQIVAAGAVTLVTALLVARSLADNPWKLGR